MKQVFFSHFLCFLSLFWFTSVSAKSRLGEYYLGFGYSMADGDKQSSHDTGDILSIMANSPATQSADWRLALEYGNYDLVPDGDKTSWGLTLDYIMHYDDYVFQNGMFRPYFGIGLGYFSDGAKIHLNDNGFNWSLMVGSEMLFTDDLSMYFGGSF
ncbi:MAG: outer membrane beta-barrel protein [Verrucomicrobia bacterium]|nr:outer membrane beta-barrel protein [Verrucomicrobiota bacterium]